MSFSRYSYLIREGFRSITTHGFMSFASVTIIMACLIIMGSVGLLSVNIDAVIKGLENENEVVAFVDETINDQATIDKIGQDIKALPNVSSAEFVGRDEAMARFMSQYDEDFGVGIDEGTFRHRYVIQLTDIALMSQTISGLEAIGGVADTRAHLEYANFFVMIRNIVSVVSLVLIVILVFVSMFIMSNTIKLATFGRREEIAIMKMVGASNAFIRLPFVVEGLVLGLLGGGLAYLAEWGIYELVTGKLMASLVGDLITVVPFSSVALPILIVYMATGILVGAFGGVNAIRNYLKV